MFLVIYIVRFTVLCLATDIISAGLGHILGIDRLLTIAFGLLVLLDTTVASFVYALKFAVRLAERSKRAHDE